MCSIHAHKALSPSSPFLHPNQISHSIRVKNQIVELHFFLPITFDSVHVQFQGISGFSTCQVSLLHEASAWPSFASLTGTGGSTTLGSGKSSWMLLLAGLSILSS